jgi:hypothetical protein
MKITDKKKIESGIPGNYDYMENLPMQGWGWEFVRRNKQYIKIFNKLEKLAEKDVWNDECIKMTTEVCRLAFPLGPLIGGRCSGVIKADRKNYIILKRPPFTGHEALLNKFFGGDNYHITAIPRPEKRYCDFHWISYRPQIPDYKIYNPSDFMQKPHENFLYGGKDVFCIVVSKHAKIADLKDRMLADIASILKKNKPKIRQRKWKYYLIVYDLKQQFNKILSYDELADILRNAYHENETICFDSTRNIINWYDSATFLINGGFKKYLKYET